MTDQNDNAAKQAHVRKLLESWGVSVAAMPSEADHWIELSCALSMPPDLIAHFYERHLLWAGLAADFAGIGQLGSEDVAAIRRDFFLGSVGVKAASDRLARLIPAVAPRSE